MKGIVCTPQNNVPRKIREAAAQKAPDCRLWTVEEDVEGFENLTRAMETAPVDLPRQETAHREQHDKAQRALIDASPLLILKRGGSERLGGRQALLQLHHPRAMQGGKHSAHRKALTAQKLIYVWHSCVHSGLLRSIVCAFSI